MTSARRVLAVLCAAALPIGSFALLSSTVADAHPRSDRTAAVSTVLDWQLIAIRTIYTERATPIPVGTLYLGFTSLAVHDAVQQASHRHNVSARAAVAVAAHDVLLQYFPDSAANLTTDLQTTLDAVPNSSAERKGIRIGRRAAAELIASREDDGRGDTSITYAPANPTAPGVFTPVVSPPGPPGGMLAPWLGYVDPLVLRHHVKVDGPDDLTSAEYAADVNEVKRDGSAASTDATKQAIAAFFYANSVISMETALIGYLREHPMGLERTARMFAVINASMADAIRNIWKLKREVGFWRPDAAIRRADEDHNDATVADPGWQPYRATPPYSDYASGHAVVTGTFAETVRMYLGDATPLTLVSVPTTPPLPSRSYATMTALEREAFNSRIWAGIHFRDAMDDGYYIAHKTARRVDLLLRWRDWWRR